MQNEYDSIAEAATSLFTDRASKFYGFAWPVQNEEDVKAYLEGLRKEHFKARHHCFAWRLGIDGNLFRASDDGEPSGTAGKPILAQIDAQGLTNVLVVVVRYFGGTLLGASGLINAYREAAHLALSNAHRVTHYFMNDYIFQVHYHRVAAFSDLTRKTSAQIRNEDWSEHLCTFHLSVKRQDANAFLDKLKAGLHGLPATEAGGLDWPEGVTLIEQ